MKGKIEVEYSIHATPEGFRAEVVLTGDTGRTGPVHGNSRGSNFSTPGEALSWAVAWTMDGLKIAAH